LKHGMLKKISVFLLLIMLTGPARAYDFKDVVRDMAPDGEGTEIAIEYISFLQKFVRLADKDEKGRSLFYLIREAIMDFDLSRLYQSDYFTQWENGFYGVSFRGDNVAEKIAFQIIAHDEALKASQEERAFGSFAGEFAIRKNLKPPVGRLSDTLVINSDWVSGDITWVHITRLLDNLMRVIDPDNLDLLRRQKGCKKEESFDVTDVFRENFSSLFTDRNVLDLSSKAVIKAIEGCRYTDFTLTVGSDAEGVERHFPLVAEYMKKMNKHGCANIIVKDKQKRTLLELFLGAQKDFLRLKVCTRKGMVIPVDTKLDRPVMNDAFAVHSLEDYRWEPHVTMTGRALGLKMSISSQVIDAEYATDGKSMHLAHKMFNKPDVKISGAVLGIIPVAAIDMVIPGTVNGLADDFSTVMMQANRGQGTLFEADWEIREPGTNRLNWKGQTEFPDNDFIRIGMKLFARVFLMDEETFDEFRQLISTGLAALQQDLCSMRRLTFPQPLTP